MYVPPACPPPAFSVAAVQAIVRSTGDAAGSAGVEGRSRAVPHGPHGLARSVQPDMALESGNSTQLNAQRRREQCSEGEGLTDKNYESQGA